MLVFSGSVFYSVFFELSVSDILLDFPDAMALVMAED
jgi:hypothetical protein